MPKQLDLPALISEHLQQAIYYEVEAGRALLFDQSPEGEELKEAHLARSREAFQGALALEHILVTKGTVMKAPG